MLEVTTAGWLATLGLIAGLLAFDLFRAGRRPHAVGFREAVGWSIFYVAVAIAFGVAFGVIAGWDLGGQYFAGYIVEKSLSVDNLFVFLIIMGAFAVPAEHQPRALTIGIVVALVLRAIFIAVGAALLDAFSFMFLVFGLMLVVTGVQLYRHRDQDPSVQDNVLVSAARRVVPVSGGYDGGKLITEAGGRRVATPLFLVLLAIGGTDFVFALDSIPAVFGVTQHAYIVFVTNAFALLGLRSLFFLVSGLLDRLVYLSTGLSLILGVHRRQARAALRPPPQPRRPGDIDGAVAGGDHPGAGDGDRGESDQGAPGPEPARTRRVACATRAAAGGPPIRRPTPSRYTLAPILRRPTIGEAWHPQLSDKEGHLMGSTIDSTTDLRDREAAAAARRASARASGSQLNCPRCGLTIEPRAPWLTIRYCPRCLARGHRIVELLQSAVSA